jgi:general secretion pathway protein E
MRYPLPYAFARTHQLLLEDDAGDLTLCLHPESASSAVSEVMRKYPVRRCRRSPARW